MAFLSPPLAPACPPPAVPALAEADAVMAVAPASALNGKLPDSKASSG